MDKKQQHAKISKELTAQLQYLHYAGPQLQTKNLDNVQIPELPYLVLFYFGGYWFSRN